MNKRYVVCLPMEHQGVHKNLFKNVRAFQDRIGVLKCWLLTRRGENRSTRKKSREPTKNAVHKELIPSRSIGKPAHSCFPV